MVGASAMVRDFCCQWNHGMDRVAQAVRRYFRADTVWENVGWSTTTGPDEAIALWTGFAALGFSDIRVDMLHIAECDGRVLTERVDHLIGLSGEILISARLMGIFEIDGDNFTAWRDYTDPAVLAAVTARR